MYCRCSRDQLSRLHCPELQHRHKRQWSCSLNRAVSTRTAVLIKGVVLREITLTPNLDIDARNGLTGVDINNLGIQAKEHAFLFFNVVVPNILPTDICKPVRT